MARTKKNITGKKDCRMRVTDLPNERDEKEFEWGDKKRENTLGEKVCRKPKNQAGMKEP